MPEAWFSILKNRKQKKTTKEEEKSRQLTFFNPFLYQFMLLCKLNHSPLRVFSANFPVDPRRPLQLGDGGREGTCRIWLIFYSFDTVSTAWSRLDWCNGSVWPATEQSCGDRYMARLAAVAHGIRADTTGMILSVSGASWHDGAPHHRRGYGRGVLTTRAVLERQHTVDRINTD